jgi:hypothetical protein
MRELKPCPFCGGEADYMPDRLMADGADPPVFCDGCHASALDAAAWNRRAPVPAAISNVMFVPRCLSADEVKLMHEHQRLFSEVRASAEAEMRERAAGVAETARLPLREVAGGPMAGWQTFPHEWPATIAAAIRALPLPGEGE